VTWNWLWGKQRNLKESGCYDSLDFNKSRRTTCQSIWAQKIEKKIFVQCKNEDGSWRIRMNYELNELIENADIVKFVKSRRIAWLGSRDADGWQENVSEWKPLGTRIRRRARKRWVVDIEEDMQITGIKGWRKQCKERTEWKRITEKAKTRTGL